MVASTKGNKYNEGWMRSGGCRWEGGIQEAIMNMRSLCFYFSALELSTQLFVEYIDCHAILMTPSTRIFPDSLLIGPRFLFRTKKILPTCLLCDQYVVSWNEATGFNMILWDQIAPFDPRHDSSDLLYPTGSSVHMHITSRNMGNGEEICDRKNNTVPLQGCVC